MLGVGAQELCSRVAGWSARITKEGCAALVDFPFK